MKKKISAKACKALLCILALTSALVNAGCGRQADKASGALLTSAIHSSTSSLPFDSHYGVFCSSGDCPSYVGALVVHMDPVLDIPGVDSQSPLGFCSVTLIGPNQILTSTHCIPPRLRVVGASCTDSMDIRFPELKGEGLATEQLVCDQIENFQAIADDGRGMDIEWAIISLKTPSARPLAKIKQRPLEMGTKIHGYPVSYNPFFPIGEIQKVTCEVSELGYLYPQTFHPSSALFYANDCSRNVIQGNSGTSFFDDSASLVAMLSAIVHQKFQSTSQVLQQGSPLIIGTKSLCFPILGETPDICKLKLDENAFGYATVMTSTLQAFTEGLVKNKIDSSRPNSSKFISWALADETNVNSVFLSFYGDSNYINSHAFFLEKKLPEVAAEMRQKVATILGQVPICINKKSMAGKRSVQDSFDYSVFSFADYEVYPAANGAMYFRMMENMRLEVGVQRIQLPVQITKMPGAAGDNYMVEFQRKSDPFALTASEQNHFDVDCVQEQQAKASACGDDQSCQEEPKTRTPSLKCQSIYKKKGFSNYLKTFSFQLPSC